MKCGIITLTQSTIDTDNFDIYSDADGFITPFETGISRVLLIAGHYSDSIPDSATVIRATSNAGCTNSVDAIISTTPTPTPTMTNTPTVTPSVTPSVTPTGTPAVTPTSTATSTPSVTPTGTPSTTPAPVAPTPSPVWYYYEATQYNCPSPRTTSQPCNTPSVSTYWIYNPYSNLVLGDFYYYSDLDQMVEITSSANTYSQYVTAGSPIAFETHFLNGYADCDCLPYII